MTDLSTWADVLWRALTYLSVAQLHLRSNPLVMRPLEPSDVKPRASGHWGTVPGTAWALVHVGLLAGRRPDLDIIPLIGAGHAGVVQRATAWLTCDFAKANCRLHRNLAGLEELISSFPDVSELGSEVHPSLPAGRYLGGWLGGALAFAQGLSLSAPAKVVIPIVGDGECETPTTAASWLAQRALAEARVLPIVHLNGHRMGGPSVLGTMSDEQVSAYLQGQGWESAVVRIGMGGAPEHSAFHEALAEGIDATCRGEHRAILLRCVKGWSGPTGAHKTPLTNLDGDSHQRVLLGKWLASYRPHELFNGDAEPIGTLAAALDNFCLRDEPPAASETPGPVSPAGRGFSTEVCAVLRTHAATGDFKVFSPDELRSNHLGELVSEPWVHEVLAEEVLLGWLAGWTAGGRRGVLVSYEAFASLLLTGLVGHLKQRRLGGSTLPSINVLLTSYGWHNVYTHGDPSLITALLGTGDPALHVFTPADANRAALALDDALRSRGQVNLIIAGKHPVVAHPYDTIEDERRDGLAVWHHLSDSGEPDLTLVCVGDLAAAVVSEAVACVRTRLGCRVRVVNVHELSALAGPALRRCLGEHTPVLVATLGQPAAIWGLLAGSVDRRIEVVGWREPPHPMSQHKLAAYAGLDVAGIASAATSLLALQDS